MKIPHEDHFPRKMEEEETTRDIIIATITVLALAAIVKLILSIFGG